MLATRFNPKDLGGIVVGKGADVVELAFNDIGARRDDTVDRAACCVNLLAGAAKRFLVVGKLSLNGGEHAKHVVGAFLQTERLVAHLQAVQERRHGGGARHVDMVVSLQDFDQPGTIDHLGIEPFEGQKHDGEVGGFGHAEILARDIFRLALNARLERAPRRGD